MRSARWSTAAFVMFLSGASVVLGGLRVEAADTVTMGTNANNNAFAFAPADITVPVGSTVVWRNLSDLQHDASADNGAFKSPLLNKGEVFEFKFTAPGEFTYVCTVSGHADAGMKGVVKVTGGSSTPAPPATTPTTTQPPAPGASTTTSTTARPGPPTTTTTAAKNGAASGATTTTTAGAADPGVTTTSGPGTAPTSPPDVAGETTTTTTTGHGAGEAAAGGDHAGSGGSEEKRKSSPIGIAFAGISTVILAGIAGKLLASRP